MNKKIVLYTIIILLIIFLPLTIFSYTLKDRDNTLKDENPHHFPYFNGSLWFYNEDAKLINKYNCENERCTYAYPIINKKYVFIKDGNKIKLYDIMNNKINNTFDEVKEEDNNYLVKKDNLWGIYKVDEDIKEVIKINYEDIKIINNKFILKNGNKWQISDDNKIIVDNINNEVVNFNNNYIICQDMKIYDYNGNLYMNENTISNYAISNNYLALVINNILYIYQYLNNNYVKSYYLNNIQNISLEEDNNSLLIKQDNILLDTLAIS